MNPLDDWDDADLGALARPRPADYWLIGDGRACMILSDEDRPATVPSGVSKIKYAAMPDIRLTDYKYTFGRWLGTAQGMLLVFGEELYTDDWIEEVIVYVYKNWKEYLVDQR